MQDRIDPMAILAAARRVEERGIEFYRNFSLCARDERGAALLRGLARDEEEHKERVEREMRRIDPARDVGSVTPAPSLLGIVPDAAFPFPAGGCLRLEDEIKALELGIEVEVRSIEMYGQAARMVEDAPSRSMLQKLMHVEQGHRKLLEDSLDLLRREGTWYGYTPILEG